MKKAISLYARKLYQLRRYAHRNSVTNAQSRGRDFNWEGESARGGRHSCILKGIPRDPGCY